MNEEQMENRFGYLREKTTEELQLRAEQIDEELESFENVFNTTKNSNQKKDAWDDIKFLHDEASFVEKVLKERSKTR